MAKISLDYGKCNSVVSSIGNAVSYAATDRSNLSSALSLASGCFGGSSTEIKAAINAIDEIKEDLVDFKRNFNSLVVDVKEYDSTFRSSLDTVEGIVVATKNEALNILTSGTNGGYGAYKSIVSAVKSNCYLEILPNGRVRVVGDSLDRASAGVKANGATYKIGSQSYYAAGLDHYVPRGSSFSEFSGRYLQNLKESGTKALNSLSNPTEAVKSFGKNTFGFQSGDIVGNCAKGLSYAAIAYDTGTHAYANIKNGASGTKVAADVTVDVAKGLGGMAVATACANVGAAIGTAIPIPVVGTVAGAVLGFAAGYAGASVYNFLVSDCKINGKSVAEWASTGIENGLNAIGDGLSKAKDAVGDFFSGVGKFAFG